MDCESIVDANGSKGREGCAKDADDAVEGGDMNEYTLRVFVLISDRGYCGANPNSDCVAEGGGVGKKCGSRFLRFRGAV